MDIVRWFEQLGRDDVAVAGGKGANLGELTRAGLPVPRGFVVTAAGFVRAMELGGVRDELRAEFAEACRRVDDRAALAECSRRLAALVHKAGVPDEVRAAVIRAYEQLGPDVAVAVRSSATAEDTAGTSFAGMHATFANVVGADELLARLVDCWASLYGERVIAYRTSHGLTEEPVIAVVVQALVESERSGVLFTADPSTNDRGRIVIEGAFGLGEVVVGGQVEPDTYVVAKDGLRIVSARVGRQSHKLVSAAQGVQRIELSEHEASARVLSDAEVVGLARLGLRVEQLYGGEPQDIEWAIAGGELYLLQARPITSLRGEATADAAEAGEARVLVRGLAASTGIVSGPVRVLRSPEEGGRLQPGEVLVAPMTNPDWVPTLRRAAAIVTDGGGMTCHAAIVARELGVPCVVGARTATTTLRDGEVVTVDGGAGVVLAGAAQPAPQPGHQPRHLPDHPLVPLPQQHRQDVLADPLPPDVVPAVAARHAAGIEVHPVRLPPAPHQVAAAADPPDPEPERPHEPPGLHPAGGVHVHVRAPSRSVPHAGPPSGCDFHDTGMAGVSVDTPGIARISAENRPSWRRRRH